ncbi:metallophosphoesterase [Bacillus sp. HMF5848]|uniref:metallophosphoesterase n=1 Tax=Bacillus sp. HMF5848 TaxID=2495421 RepID=UPI000F7A716B|nr:metallophosphoesterase [Bacillus sp. HMF5848]RSK26837.1 metallophosphoesterase [Bacillus sp. HMF5848]
MIKLAKKLLVSFFLLFSLYVYARFIEPSWLQINEYSIQHPLIQEGFKNLTIVQFSDTHLGHYYNIADLQHIINKINSFQPDIVFFTGDLIDQPNVYTDANLIPEVLKQLNAPLGKFAVYGNHDHGGYGTEIYEQVLEDSNFTLLVNETRSITLLDGSTFNIVGIDDAMFKREDFTLATSKLNTNSYSILLAHEPDVFEVAVNYSIDLQLSGHSHGGQIQIPFVGPLITPPQATTYYEGFYELKSAKLYVNRGLGTTRLPYRFLARPEITVFHFEPQ